MPSRLRSLLLALGLVLALLAGCSDSSAADRNAGDKVTRDEADVLAELLHQDFKRGGADFVQSAPYGDGAGLTLTREGDFVPSIGRAQAGPPLKGGPPHETPPPFFPPTPTRVGPRP